VRGSPIRKSSDQRSVDSSPRLIAASYVLHRLLVPRHPPCALNNLATQKPHTTTPGRRRSCGPTRTLDRTKSQKMLASTVQFSTYNQTPPIRPRRTREPPQGTRRYEKQEGPDTKQRLPAPSGPNSVPTTPHPRRPRSTPTQARAVLGAGGSRRPNWSAFHPRAPPQKLAAPPDGGTVTSWARLWTAHTRRTASAP
jgi:hypothetical protein